MPIPQEYLNNVILIVDDELAMRITLSNMVTRMGFRNALVAENGKRAMEIINSRHVDIIITDINMPVMNGIELFKSVRANKKYQHIRFIFVTAEASRQVVARAAEDGGEAYIIKPFVMATVEEKLLKVLDKKHKPNEVDRLSKEFESYLAKKDYENAEKILKQIKGIVGETPKVLYNSGRLASLQGDIQSAIESYKQAIDRNPMFVKAYNALGEAFESLGDIQTAIRYYEIAHEISPANTERLITLSKLLHKTGESEKAASLLKNAVSDVRGDISTSAHLLGEIYLSSNENEKAIEALLKAHKKNPSDTGIMKSLAEAYRKVGKTELALDMYHKILEISGDNAEIYYEMGKAFLETGQKAKAIEYIKKAWELNPFSQQITADLRALARSDKVAL